MKKCRKCGAINADESNFCGECGTALEQKKRKNHFPIKTGLVAVIVLLCVIGVAVIASLYAHNEYTPAGDHVFKGESISEAGKKADESTDEKKITGFQINGYEYSGKKEKYGYCIVKEFDKEKYGLIDPNGKMVLAAEYDDMYFLSIKKAKAVAVQSGNQWGVYDFEGNEVLPVEYEKIQCEIGDANLNSGDVKGDYYLATKGEKKEIVSFNGKIIKTFDNKFPNESSSIVEGNDFLIMHKENSDSIAVWEIYNLEGTQIADNVASFDLLTESECLISVIKDINGEKSGIYEVINGEGEILFSTQNMKDSNGNQLFAESLQSDRWIKLYTSNNGESENKKYYLYDMQTGQRIETAYDSVYAFDQDKICAVTAGMIDIYNETGNLEKTIQGGTDNWIGCDASSPYLVLPRTDNMYNICTSDGTLINNENYQFYWYVDGVLILQNQEGQYGIMDHEGILRVPFGDIVETENNNEMSDMKYFSYQGEAVCSFSMDENHLYIQTENTDEKVVRLTVL